MIIALSKAKRRARELLRENRGGATWRELSEKYGVNHATLNRFANKDGRWLPKDETILQKLGLISRRSPYAVMPRWWNRTPEALRSYQYLQNQVRVLSNETRAAQYAHKNKRCG